MQNQPHNPVSLGALIAEGKLMWTYCNECGRERDLYPASIPLPADVPVYDIGKRMICTACGSRKITTRPELCPGGVIASRARRVAYYETKQN